jgi:hypothetical protein
VVAIDHAQKGAHGKFKWPGLSASKAVTNMNNWRRIRSYPFEIGAIDNRVDGGWAEW